MQYCTKNTGISATTFHIHPFSLPGLSGQEAIPEFPLLFSPEEHQIVGQFCFLLSCCAFPIWSALFLVPLLTTFLCSASGIIGSGSRQEPIVSSRFPPVLKRSVYMCMSWSARLHQASLSLEFTATNLAYWTIKLKSALKYFPFLLSGEDSLARSQSVLKCKGEGSFQ